MASNALVSGFYQEVLKQSVEIWHKLEDKPWTMREFGVVTPDGVRRTDYLARHGSRSRPTPIRFLEYQLAFREVRTRFTLPS
jgi:hypothetical protein